VWKPDEQTSPIRAIDFRNFTYPWYPSPYRPPHGRREVTLSGGKFIVDGKDSDSDVTFGLANVSYADLTRDGKEEAVVTIDAGFNPNGSRACIFVYGMNSGAPTAIWSHETGNRAYGGLRSIRIAGGDLVIEQYASSLNEKPVPCMTCAKRYTRTTYQWDGRHFREINVETLPNESENIDFLGYPNQ
jgi:hypothetical protein